MIPLVYFLIAWLVLVGIFALMAFITVIMNVRYGLSGLTTYVTTAAFLAVVVVVLFGVGGYFLSVDWSQDVSFTPGTADIYDL